MKTTKLFLMAALALTFAACSNDNYDAAQPAKAEGIPFTATISIGDGATTRALTKDGSKLVASWAEGEKVALIHNSVSDEMEVSAVNNGVATITGTITGSPSNGDAVTVIYPSTAADGTTGNVKADLLYAQEGGTLPDVASKYDVRKGTGTLKVSDKASLDGNVSLANQFAIFKFTTKNADGSATIDVSALTVTIGEQAYVITPSDATSELYAALPEVSSQKVRFSATGSDSKTYAFSKNNVSFTKGKFYQSTLKMTEVVPEAVDLGLPSGTLWANMNVGATSESDYGDFFAWGATTDNLSASKNYQWTNTPYYTGDGSTHSWSKYTGSDKTTLDPEDDAATANWGGDWRMPTNTEINELLATKSNANYTWEWTTVDGHNGYKITYTSTGANIFLPASGGRADTSPYSQGTEGYYWSSTFDGYVLNYAQYLFFDSSSANANYECRYVGFPVRPVQGAATPAVPDGAISGKFSVSATKKVYFSKGNLQYTKSTGKWSFMEHQYSTVEANNPNVGNNYANQNVVSLFGWGTGNNPNQTSEDGDYSTFTDWGTAAASSIGSGWRTLTGGDGGEWEYLFGTNPSNKRTTTSGILYAKATVNDVSGVILLPDDWSTSYHSLSSTNTVNAAFTTNTITATEWTSDFEAHGCVFLPAAGYREGTMVREVGSFGDYWSSTAPGSEYAYDVFFESDNVDPENNYGRYMGYSVRLVRDVE